MIRTAELYTKYPGDKGTRYCKYIPSNGVTPKGVILFFHGQGEISSTDLTLVDNNGLPAYLKVDGVKDGMEIPFIVLCPQEEPPAMWWSRASDSVKLARTFNLPIHKCGLSLGSMVDAEIINNPELGLNVFATVATCCGKINTFPNTLSELGKIPTIHYYDPADKKIDQGYSSVKSIHDKLKSAGKDSTMIEYTMPSGQAHNVWTKAYNPAEPTNYITWLLTKVSVTPPPVEPPIEPTPIKDMVIENYWDGTSLIFKTQSGLVIKK